MRWGVLLRARGSYGRLGQKRMSFGMRSKEPPGSCVGHRRGKVKALRIGSPGCGEGSRLEGRAKWNCLTMGVKEASGQEVRRTLNTAL